MENSYEWDLSVLYKGLDDPKYHEDILELDALIEEYNAFALTLSGDKTRTLINIINKSEKLQIHMERLLNYLSLAFSIDATNNEIQSQMSTISAKLANISKAQTLINNYIAATLDLAEIINTSVELKPYKAYLLCIKEDNQYALSAEVEEVIAKLSTNSTENWMNLQNYLTSVVEVNYGDEILNLSQVRNLAYDNDSAVRKSAYEAELASYAKIKEPVAFALNSLKGHVNTECELRGYASPLDRTLKGARMKRETLDALFSAIDDYLPKFHAYLKKKGEMLDHQNGLPWYDLFAPMGEEAKIKFTVESSKDYLIENFKDFSSDMCKMIETAYADHWIDFLPKKGKAGGAFCAGLMNIKQSRILTNFDGSLSDCVTLAHELGHAYHNTQLYDVPELNAGYAMPLAESASTFNETVVMNNAIKQAKNKQEKLKLIESTLQDVTQIICDIYSRYLFETAVFEKRHESFMGASELETMMLDAQKKAYGDGLDHNYLHPYMWVCKGHYYSADTSFYNFPYAFGGLFARGLYALYQNEPDGFLTKYNQILKATCSESVEEVAMRAKIDLTSKAFWGSSLKGVSDMIDEFIMLCE